MLPAPAMYPAQEPKAREGSSSETLRSEYGIPGRLCAALFFVFVGEVGSILFLDRDVLRNLFHLSIFWNLTLLSLLGLWACLPLLRDALVTSERRRRLLEGLLLGAFFAGLAALTLPPRLRTLMDEAALLSTSRSFAEHQNAEIVTEQFPRGEGFQTLAKFIDKRPPAFPFFIQLLHRLQGFRVENAFQGNLILGFCFFTLLFCFLAEVFTRPLAASALALASAQPLLFLVIRSGAMDLISGVLLLALFFTLFLFLRTPSRTRFQALAFLCVAVLYARYENAVISLIVPLGLFLSGQLKKEHFRNAWYFVLLALLSYGVILQRVLATTMEQSPDMPAFSWYYGVLNNLHVLQQSLRIDGDYHLLSPLVMYPALFALLSLPCAQFRISQWSLFRKLLVLSVLLTWMVITTLYAGILIHGISSRYFLFFAIFSAILAASGLSRILGAFSGPLRTPLLLLLCFGILAFSLKDTERMNSHFALSSEKTLDFVSHSTAERGVHPALVISNYPLLFSALNGGSISFAAFRSGRSFVGDLVKSGEGSERAVLVIQQLFAVSGGPYPGNEIQEPFSLESLGEFTFDGQLFRLSRLHVH